ncbi:MAG: M20/M25/M40 family metallo-hydrolase [Firmicutes bacterium]|nr:M20/M25/M40 family metallo-hydrolase [Bacillota bacterium]
MEILIFIGAALAVLLAVIFIRALRFRPYPAPEAPPFSVEFDGNRAIENLTRMIQCKTVSYLDTSLEDEGEFEKFRALLKESYPLVHKHCPLQRIGRTGLLYHWQGKSDDKPTVYMAHYDVVPAEGEAWEQPPFAGVISGGCLWGRGTLDTKGTLCAIMEAAEHLLAQGFVPENDIYLSFSGDEETNGSSAADIVDYLEAKGVKPHMVLDEGGAIVQGAVPGVKEKCALVGTGEKGKLHLKFTVNSKGGHASSPPPHSPVGILARAVCAVENKPFRFHIAAPAREMFDILGRHAGFGLKLIFANLGVFAPLLNLVARKLGGEINALVRTTVAFTKMKASDTVNVFPATASVEADVRMMEGDTAESVIAALHKRIRNEAVEIEAVNAIEVRPFSPIGTEPWQRLAEGISQIWPGTLVSPYMMLACTDSRHFTRICPNVLRFCPMELSAEERKMIHGSNERIPLEKIVTTVKFYICMMLKS